MGFEACKHCVHWCNVLRFYLPSENPGRPWVGLIQCRGGSFNWGATVGQFKVIDFSFLFSPGALLSLGLHAPSLPACPPLVPPPPWLPTLECNATQILTGSQGSPTFSGQIAPMPMTEPLPKQHYSQVRLCMRPCSPCSPFMQIYSSSDTVSLPSRFRHSDFRIRVKWI